MAVLIPFITLGLALFLVVAFRPGERLLSGIYWIGLLLKIIGALALGYIFTYIKPEGDILAYVNSATELCAQAWDRPVEYLNYLYERQYPHYESDSRNGFFVKILSLILLISGGNFWVAGVLFAMISFASSWFLVRSLSDSKSEFLITSMSFLALPSVLIWTSGVSKETVLCSALFYLLATGIRYFKGKSIGLWDFILTILSLYILVRIRYFLFGVVILAYLALVLHQLSRIPIPSVLKIVGVTFLVSLSIFFVSKLNYNLNFDHLPQSVYNNYLSIQQNSNPDFAMTFSLEPTWLSLILHLPIGLFSGLFRPVPGEGPGIYFFSQIESFLLISGLCWSGYLTIRRKLSFRPTLLFYIAVFFVVVLASLTPLSAPNYGTLIRYRTVYVPIVFFLFWYLPFRQVFSKPQD